MEAFPQLSFIWVVISSITAGVIGVVAALSKYISFISPVPFPKLQGP